MKRFLEWVVGKFGLQNSVEALVNSSGARALVFAVIDRFRLTDLFGHAVTWAYTAYLKYGRDGVVSLATIKSESLKKWAKTYRPNDPTAEGEVLGAFGRLAEAFADAVGSLIPKK